MENIKSFMCINHSLFCGAKIVHYYITDVFIAGQLGSQIGHERFHPSFDRYEVAEICRFSWFSRIFGLSLQRLNTISSMHTRLYFFLLFVLSYISHSGYAQYSITQHYLINEGRSNNFVHDFALDDKGRLWIATESGLNTFNGNSFFNYNVSNAALSANMINCLWYDQQRSSLWVGTKGIGVGCMDTNTGQVTPCNALDSSLTNVLCITPTNVDDQLWLISPEDIMLLNTTDTSISPILDCHDELYFRCGIDDGHGNLIIGTYMNGAYLLTARTHQLLPLTTHSQHHRVNVNDLITDHTGRIWIATNKGLWFYQPGSTQLLPYESLQQQEIFQLCEIDERTLWVVTPDKVMQIDLQSHLLSSLQITDEQEVIGGIQTIYQDPHGNIWIGRKGSGLDFISQQSSPFSKVFSGPVWGIYADGDIAWLGSRHRLLGFVGTQQRYDIPISVHGIPCGAIYSVNGDGDDLLYLAVPYHCLCYSKSTGSIETITTAEGRDIEALTFYREDDGTLWITATDGVYTLRRGEIEEMTSINQMLGRQSANGIRRDQQGKLWVATFENGVYIFDQQYHLLSHLTQQSGFFSNSVQHLKFDSHDRLWMSTPDGPCCIPDTRQPDQYVSYGYEQGLTDTYVRAIQEDQEGNLWISTNNGISMLRLGEQTFVNYSQSDFIPVNNLSGGAILQSDGSLLFTSLDGACHCYPAQITSPRRPSHILLQSVMMLESGETSNNQRLLLPDAKGIYHLEDKHRSFRLSFGSQDIADNRQMDFEYQIHNTTDRWMPCTRGLVTFRDLAPGLYQIKLRARLKGQPWTNATTISTKVYIPYPWWANGWARLCYVLLALALIYQFFHYYTHRLKLTNELELERRKNIDEHESNAERLQFFTNITHELKTPLTLILAPLEELLNNRELTPQVTKQLKYVYDSAHRLTDLCNKLLDFHRSATHNRQFEVCHGFIGALVEEVGKSFAELNTNPHLTITVQTQEDDQPILFDPDIVRSILTNLLSNALKYTPEGTITLTEQQVVRNGHTYTILSIRDTGYGIPADALPHIFDRYYQVKGPHQASGTGIGLSIVKAMAKLHQAEIHVESQTEQGTTFTITFDNEQQYPNALHREGGFSLPITVTDNPPAKEDDQDHRPLLLLVEDDTEILEFMTSTLTTDYRILRASNGKDGLQLAYQHIPDVVVTDLMMPVMDGITMCQQLKNDLRTSHIPVVMLTAKDTDQDKLEGYKSGADSYLTKPFNLQMLRTRLNNVLHARQRLVAWINTHPSFESEQPSGSPLSHSSAVSAQPSDSVVPELSRYDQNFLQDIKTYVISNITNETILMEDIALSLHVSHSTLYRKIKALTGMSGAEYIRRLRIVHSAELMLSHHCNISEAAYQSGFTNLSYFRSAFKDVFGMTPSEYIKSST